MTALHSIPLALIDGTDTVFGRFKGEVVLVVNVASRCGFTPQYAGLEALHNKFREQGFTVLGVPCNQFAGQEPGGRRRDRRVLRTQFWSDVPAGGQG